MAADYVTDGKIGIDLTATYQSASVNMPTPWPASPGDTVRTSNNGVYMFARAQSDVARFDVVAFATFADSASQTPTVRAVPITVAGIANAGVTGAGPMIGIAQTSIQSARYGWIALNGTNLRCNVLVSCQPKVALFATTTGGSLDDATTSVAYISGLTINTSATSASAPYCIASWPHVDILEVG